MTPPASFSYLPRRHRRRLLLPPGWVALAGLLWLGNGVLNAFPERLAFENVVQLTMPLLHPTPTDSAFLSSQQLQLFRPWRTSYFSGSVVADQRAQTHIAAIARAIRRDTLHAAGLRVQFSRQARYAQLVFLLDLMPREGIKKYCLDIREGKSVFYAVTDAPKPPFLGEPMLLGCTLGNNVLPLTPSVKPFWGAFDDWVTEAWNLILHSKWRLLLWMATATVLLSGRKLLLMRRSF